MKYESGDTLYSNTDEQNKNDKKFNLSRWLTFSFFAKVFGALSIITATFGLFVQKGMIRGMHLGNFRGIYDLHEIAASALLGYVELFDNLSGVWKLSIFWKIYPSIAAMLGLATLIVLIGLAAICITHKRNTTKAIDFKAKLDKILQNNFFVAAIISVTFQLVAFISAVLAVMITPLVLGLIMVLLLPALVGSKVGERIAENHSMSHPCITLEEYDKKSRENGQTKIVQCTQVVVGERKISGKILLAGTHGMYLRHNDGFVYTSYDGQLCIYSRDMERKEIQKGSYDLPKGEIEAFCQQR